jgi:hypothetical protein
MELRIAAEIDRQDLAPEIRDSIQTSIDTYRNESFLWNEQRTEWTTSAGQEYYTAGTDNVPTDIQWVQNMMVRVNGESYPVPHLNFWEIDNIQTNDNYRGYPEFWAWHNNAFRLYPIASGAFPVEMAYVRDLSADSGPTAGEAWYTRGELMVRAKAKSLLYAHVKQILDPNLSGFYDGIAQQEFNRVKGEADRMQASGRFTAWGY